MYYITNEQGLYLAGLLYSLHERRQVPEWTESIRAAKGTTDYSKAERIAERLNGQVVEVAA